MGTPDKYRFTVQWAADTVDKIRIGEALKGLGNKKSRLIVEAVSEYIKEHPESLSPGYKYHPSVEPALTQNQIREIVRDLIDARLANANIMPFANYIGNPCDQNTAGNDDIDAMIQNLDMFA